MNKVLIISNHENDVSKLILNNCPDAAVYDAENDNIPFEKFESLCILGGAEEKQMIIPSKNRIEVDKFIQSGKPIFCEFVASVAGVYGGNPQETTHHRLVYSDEYVDFARLKISSFNLSLIGMLKTVALDKIVFNKAVLFSVVRIKITFFGGSSNVFKKAF